MRDFEQCLLLTRLATILLVTTDGLQSFRHRDSCKEPEDLQQQWLHSQQMMNYRFTQNPEAIYNAIPPIPNHHTRPLRNNLSGLAQDSYCPWSYSNITSHNRYPRYIVQAKCTQDCDCGWDNINFQCLEVKWPIKVLKHSRGDCDVRGYKIYHPRWMSIVVGCTCGHIQRSEGPV